MHLKQEYRYEQVIKKSKFIACLKPVKTEEEARNYIESIRKEFNDATHVCTAFIIGKDRTIQRSSDNGEPAGSAGVPMLQALLNSEVDDVCACVVRYFGGIKLGVGGLVRAYSSSVVSALNEADKTIDVVFRQYTITYPYEMSGTLENYLRRNTIIKDFLYTENVTCLFETDRDICKDIQNITSGKIQPEYVKDVTVQKDI